ncbi:peptidoglycan-binding protein [Jiella sp. MQZ9-1]|uniref:Peptidoglycan-binding protein n=1 Tax=Jiella flava TaxID=2816857 RepID=A0A939JTN0_9HYPH|nr:peptidoglycan-binding protein [Jiella flava]MCD2472745.1 peptidoglycan-binding protein [Jiella flava]
MAYIEWLQARLNAHGAALVVDGDWGRASIAALKTFQQGAGLAVTGTATAASVAALRAAPAGRTGAVSVPPAETMPPWMAEIDRRRGLNEIRDNAALTAFLKIGRFLGNPKNLPWCGDCVESAFAKALPEEVLPKNPFFAQNWAGFGRKVPAIVGAVGVIRWSARAGHVGIVAGLEGDTVVLLGGNQSNAINCRGFAQRNFIAFRWPISFPIRPYPALAGTAPALGNLAETR